MGYIDNYQDYLFHVISNVEQAHEKMSSVKKIVITRFTFEFEIKVLSKELKCNSYMRYMMLEKDYFQINFDYRNFYASRFIRIDLKYP